MAKTNLTFELKIKDGFKVSSHGNEEYIALLTDFQKKKYESEVQDGGNYPTFLNLHYPTSHAH
jgi:hypothetical protein